jgi:hypothetical protein
MFFRDAYTDKPATKRGALVERIRRLKVASWADPGDKELRSEIEQAESELCTYDKQSKA